MFVWEYPWSPFVGPRPIHVAGYMYQALVAGYRYPIMIAGCIYIILFAGYRCNIFVSGDSYMENGCGYHIRVV